MTIKFSKHCYIYIFCVLAFFYNTTKMEAQNSTIYELQNQNYGADRTHFYDLAFKLHPTIYFQGITQKTLDANKPPLKINLNGATALKHLSATNYDASHVELVYISLNTPQDLNANLDLSYITKFKNLKYIFIKCCFKTNLADIERFIKVKPDTNIRIFYKIEIPS